MRKIQIFIVLLLVGATFAAADYYLNGLGMGSPRFEPAMAEKPSEEAGPVQPASLFKVGQDLGGFTVMRQVSVSQVFDRFDLAPISNIRVAKNELRRTMAVSESGSSSAQAEPMSIYEIRGPRGQGGLTYLTVKLAVLAQVNGSTETLNEDNQFGDNSFFFNDLNAKNTGFLVVQIGDVVFGFQFGKDVQSTYEGVKKVVSDLTLGR